MVQRPATKFQSFSHLAKDPLTMEKTPTRIVALEQIDAASSREPDGSRSLNDVGKHIAMVTAAWCQYSRETDPQQTVTKAKGVLAKRFDRADQSVWDLFNSRIATSSVRLGANTGQIVGGIMMFTPAAFLGLIVTTFSSLTDLATTIGQAVDGYKKNKAVRQAVDALLSDDANTLVSVLHHSKNLATLCQEKNLPFSQATYWMDALSPYVLAQKSDPTAAFFEAKMMEMVNGIVNVERQGMWGQLDRWLCRTVNAERQGMWAQLMDWLGRASLRSETTQIVKAAGQASLLLASSASGARPSCAFGTRQS